MWSTTSPKSSGWITSLLWTAFRLSTVQRWKNNNENSFYGYFYVHIFKIIFVCLCYPSFLPLSPKGRGVLLSFGQAGGLPAGVSKNFDIPSYLLKYPTQRFHIAHVYRPWWLLHVEMFNVCIDLDLDLVGWGVFRALHGYFLYIYGHLRYFCFCNNCTFISFFFM